MKRFAKLKNRFGGGGGSRSNTNATVEEPVEVGQNPTHVQGSSFVQGRSSHNTRHQQPPPPSGSKKAAASAAAASAATAAARPKTSGSLSRRKPAVEKGNIGNTHGYNTKSYREEGKKHGESEGRKPVVTTSGRNAGERATSSSKSPHIPDRVSAAFQEEPRATVAVGSTTTPDPKAKAEAQTTAVEAAKKHKMPTKGKAKKAETKETPKSPKGTKQKATKEPPKAKDERTLVVTAKGKGNNTDTEKPTKAPRTTSSRKPEPEQNSKSANRSNNTAEVLEQLKDVKLEMDMKMDAADDLHEEEPEEVPPTEAVGLPSEINADPEPSTFAEAWEMAAKFVGHGLEPVGQDALEQFEGCLPKEAEDKIGGDEEEHDIVVPAADQELPAPNKMDVADTEEPDTNVDMVGAEVAAAPVLVQVLPVPDEMDVADTEEPDIDVDMVDAEAAAVEVVVTAPVLEPLDSWEFPSASGAEKDAAGASNDDASFTFSDNSSDGGMDVDTPEASSSGVNVHLLSDILDQGNAAIESIEAGSDVVLVVGGTGAGKSTFIQSISGRKIVKSWDSALGKSCYVTDDNEKGGESGFEIGHGLKSMTRHVRPFFREETSTFYVDSSGFGDTEGIETDIATSVCVRNVARRAGRLRFVVLINAFQFFSDRASELRKNLDVVAKFIGHNFVDHKLSFTFFFTHCNEVFPEVRSVIKGSSNTAAILGAMREEVARLLGATKQATSDSSTLELIKFLRGSLKKSYPFCDVFDPTYSDIAKTRKDVEPVSAEAHIKDPATVVECSLTPTAKMRLDREVSQRMSAVSCSLKEGNIDDTLRQDVLSITSLVGHIGSLGKDVKRRLDEDLAAASEQMKSNLFQIVKLGTLSAPPDAPSLTLEDALVAKKLIEDGQFVDGLLGVQAGEELLSRLLSLLSDQAAWIEGEVRKLANLLEGSCDPIDWKKVSTQFANLRVWASALSGGAETSYREAHMSVRGCLESLCNTVGVVSSESHQLKPEDGPLILYAVSVFKTVTQSGLVHRCLEADDMAVWGSSWETLTSVAKLCIHDIKQRTQTAVIGTFNSPMSPDSEHVPKKTEELVDLLGIVDLMQNIAEKESIRSLLGGVSIWRSTLAVAAAEFLQRLEVCSKLIQNGRVCDGKMTHLCFVSLQDFVGCLPNTIKSGAGFISHLDTLQRELEQRVRDILDSVRVATLQLASNGVVGQPAQHVLMLAELRNFVWLDKQPRKSRDFPSVGDTLQMAYTAYSNHASSLVESCGEALDVALGNTAGCETRRNKAEVSAGLYRTLVGITRISPAVKSSLGAFQSKVVSWCNLAGQSIDEMPVTKPDLVFLDSVILVGKALQRYGAAARDSLVRLVHLARNKIDTFCAGVVAVFNEPTAFSKQELIVGEAERWAGLAEVRRRMPTLSALLKVVRSRFVKLAETLHQQVKEPSESIDMEGIDEQFKYLQEAAGSFDIYLEGVCSTWVAGLHQSIEARKADLDTRFEEQLEENDFQGIRLYLVDLDKPSLKTKHRQCLKVISAHLWALMDSAKADFMLPASSASERDATKTTKKLELLTDAEVHLGDIGLFPPASEGREGFVLDGTSASLREEAVGVLGETLEVVAKAVGVVDFACSVVAMEHCIFLQKVCSITDKAVGKQQDKVEGLFKRFATSVSLFLASFHEEAGANPGFSQHQSQWTPPDTQFLHTCLSSLQNSSSMPGCHKRISEVYTSSTKAMSSELNALWKSLQTECAGGQFTRSVKMLGFLKKELLVSGLKNHVELDFDINVALEQAISQKNRHERAFRNVALDKKEIDRIAADLEQRSGSFNSMFGNYDYENDKKTLSTWARKETQNSVGMIENAEFFRLRENIASLQHARNKLGGHMNFHWNLEGVLLPVLSSRLSRMVADMGTALRAHNYEHVQQILFPPFLDLMESVHIASSSRQQEQLLGEFDKICLEFQKKVHEKLSGHLCGASALFDEKISGMKFEEVSIFAEKLQSCGYFFITAFALYSQTCRPTANDPKLQELMSLAQKMFGGGRIARIGSCFSLLELPPSSSRADISKSYKRLSRLYHPDKNPGIKKATAKSGQLNEAYEVLSDDASIQLFHSYDFPFLVGVVGEIGLKLNTFVKASLDAREYGAIVLSLENLGGVEQLDGLMKNTPPTDVMKLRHDLTKIVKGHANKIVLGIQKAHSNQSFINLHHSFADLEAFEKEFQSFNDILDRSLVSDTLDQLNVNIDKLKASAMFLSGQTEATANRDIEEFANRLINLGHFHDGFPRLKKKTSAAIHSVLNSIQAEPWGVSFIFKLGLLLEKGELSGDEEDKRVGRVIVGSFRHFQDVRTVVFNREVVTADIVQSVENTTTNCYDGSAALKSVVFDRTVLKGECDRYENLFNRHFSDFVQDGHDELVQHLLASIHRLGSCSVKNWNTAVKSKITEILAGVFATFTIIKSGESFRRFKEHSESEEEAEGSADASSILFRPHNIQIIAILRLLGIGSSEHLLPNHIMEVRTGEGKSIILGALATVLALLGFTVKCVCYEDHLSERDNELFKDVFATFGIVDRVQYSKITTMSEDTVAEKGDIRQLTIDLVKGNLTASPKRRSAPFAKTNKERSRGHIFKGGKPGETPAQLKTNKQTNELKTSEVDSSSSEPTESAASRNFVRHPPLALNNEEILLVDEVDVFFGPDFYGKTYNQVAELSHPVVAKLMQKIWDCRTTKPSFSAVSHWPEYAAVIQKFSKWTLQIETEVRKMCGDVQNFAEPAYEVDRVNCRIGYSHLDSIDWDQTFGYRTAFAHLFEKEQGTLSGSLAENVISQALSVRLSCGQFSYAAIEPTAVLGVSGTLRALTAEEQSIVNDFSVNTYSFVPSVYGPNNLTFDRAGRGITIENDSMRHLQEIAYTMQQAVTEGRSAIAFFENDEKLLEFQKSSHWRQFRNANVLSSTTDKDTRKYVINKAATSKQVTIATAVFGRGTDFFCKDSKLESNGGMVVVQTFLSVEKSEELQVQGRTARQGKKGSYCMVLLESDLIQKFGFSPGQWSTVPKKDLYDLLDERRKEVHGQTLKETKESVVQASERDSISRSYLNALIAGDSRKAAGALNTIYEIVKNDSKAFNFCRMVCCLDATVSMEPVWEATKNCIHEMLKRIDDIGEGQFELMFVAYRDYTTHKEGCRPLLEKSNWSKNPKDLSDFVSNIQTGWGMPDWAEAVEHALEFANEEHERGPITRVIVIGDAPPHFQRKGEPLPEHDNRLMTTDFHIETERLRLNGIPTYTFRLNDDDELVETFGHIASETGGETHLLDIQNSGSNKLIDYVCETALEDIGGSDLVAEYRARHGGE